MKRSAVLFGLGGFLLVAALMLKFYAYPRLAVVPLNQNTTSVSLGPGAHFFSVAKLAPATADLTSTRRVVGDVKASEEASKALGKDIAVWKTGVVTDDDGKAPPIAAYTERVAFERHTGEAVNCCGESYNGKPVKHSGLVYKLPFRSEKKTYQFWDSTLLKALPMSYRRTTEINGVTVYEYVQNITRTRSGTTEVPPSVLGLPGTGSVSATDWYSNVRTLWVEPETGVIIKGQEKQYNTIEAPGADPLVATDVTIAYDAPTVKHNTDTYGPKSNQLELVRVWLPLATGVLGLILLGAGLFLFLRSGGGRRAD